MGAIMKALSGPSAHSVKKTSLFADVKDRIDGAIIPKDLDEVEQWLIDNDHTYPSSWRDSFNDMIELKREELEAENIGSIVRDKFDFT